MLPKLGSNDFYHDHGHASQWRPCLPAEVLELHQATWMKLTAQILLIVQPVRVTVDLMLVNGDVAPATKGKDVADHVTAPAHEVLAVVWSEGVGGRAEGATKIEAADEIKPLQSRPVFGKTVLALRAPTVVICQIDRLAPCGFAVPFDVRTSLLILRHRLPEAPVIVISPRL